MVRTAEGSKPCPEPDNCFSISAYIMLARIIPKCLPKEKLFQNKIIPFEPAASGKAPLIHVLKAEAGWDARSCSLMTA